MRFTRHIQQWMRGNSLSYLVGLCIIWLFGFHIDHPCSEPEAASFTSDTDVSLRPHCPEIMWSSHPLSLIISFILDVTFSSSVFICLSAWRPRLTSDQCRRICEFLKVWRGKITAGRWTLILLGLQACVCVCRLVYGEPIIRVSTANSALVLGSAGRLLSHQLWQHNTSSPFLSLSMLFLFFFYSCYLQTLIQVWEKKQIQG